MLSMTMRYETVSTFLNTNNTLSLSSHVHKDRLDYESLDQARYQPILMTLVLMFYPATYIAGFNTSGIALGLYCWVHCQLLLLTINRLFSLQHNTHCHMLTISFSIVCTHIYGNTVSDNGKLSDRYKMYYIVHRGDRTVTFPNTHGSREHSI